MKRTDGLNMQALAQYAPRPGARPLIRELSPKAQVALMCHMLHREGWDDHIAGHISSRQADGAILTNPWELAWDEVTASDIVTLDADGNNLDSDWNITPAIGLHLQLHAARKDAHVVLHNHPHWSGIWASLKASPPVYDQAGAYCGVDLPVYDEYAGTLEDGSSCASAVEALGDAHWALLANHGSLVVARDLRQAHLRAITLEWRSKRAYEVRLAGGAEPLADAMVEQIAIADTNGFPFLWEAMARRALRHNPSILD